MRKFIIKRETIFDHLYNSKAKLGTLYYKKEKLCKTLENPWLWNKKNVSCIPEGTYICERSNEGRFKYWNILDVPDRSNIEIHQGNKVSDTEGCILFGRDWCIMDGELAINHSRSTLDYLKDEGILPDIFKLKIVAN